MSTMITEDYVSYEVAKLLKEKGFDWSCGDSYVVANKIIYPKPTHQMAMKWLRNEKNILLYVYPVIVLPPSDDNTFHWRWDGKKKIYAMPHIGDKHNYESYEEAVEAALKYALENLI